MNEQDENAAMPQAALVASVTGPDGNLVAGHTPCAREHVSPRANRYGALDLGTNNCRLLIAQPDSEGFRVVDAFSRIVRLGEGLSHTGLLAEEAVTRTLDALQVCSRKLQDRGVLRTHLVATEACRVARNGPDFLNRITSETGLELKVLDRQSEAHLAAAGCAVLADPCAESIILFDIGGGSTELVWLGVKGDEGRDIKSRIRAWTSMPIGVVTLSERFGGVDVSPECFEAMILETLLAMAPFIEAAKGAPRSRNFHLLGTSGTVTTLGGIFLGLERYDRRKVDGLWMADHEVSAVQSHLRAMPFEIRASNGCIGRDRADLVLPGCAIFEAIRRAFPSQRLRIGDRGLREGMLMEMMRADGALRATAAKTSGLR